MVESSTGLNHLDWSPDKQKIACSGYIGANNETVSIYIFNAIGTDLIRITTTDNVWDYEPRWSPAGEMIAFTRIYPYNGNKEEIWMMKSDGSKICYTYSNGDANTFEIYVMNSDGSGNIRLTNNNSFDGSPRWSPDGNRIVYSSDAHQTDKWEIYIMNSDGTKAKRITNSPSGITAIDPVWKPEI
jgi:Tol biopolymer transport system component